MYHTLDVHQTKMQGKTANMKIYNYPGTYLVGDREIKVNDKNRCIHITRITDVGENYVARLGEDGLYIIGGKGFRVKDGKIEV